MSGRFALIAAHPDDEQATALAGLLGDPARGGYTVERVSDRASTARFFAARVPTDVVLVHADGVPVDAAALAACRSTHVLVLATDRHADVPDAPHRAVIAGAPTAAIVRALRDGRADGDGDGDVTARELHNRLAHTHDVRLSDELDTPFVIARTRRPARRDRRLSRAVTVSDLRVVTGAGSAAVLVSLPLAWIFGGSGLEYAFAADTAWPSRIAPLLALVAALAGIVQVVTLRGAVAVGVLATAAGGALYGLLDRFAEPDPGLGLLFACGGLALLLGGALPAILKRLDHLGFACGAAAALAYQVVGPRNWGWMALFAVLLVVLLAQDGRED